MRSSVFILGARGSVPVCRQDVLRYGGATLCISIRLAGQPVVLDAGTGILDLATRLRSDETDIPLLLSHGHVDHLMGLPMCPVLFDPKRSLHIYGAARNGLSVKEQLETLMSPPLWPVQSEQIGAQVTFHTVEGSFDLGSVHVDVMDGIHPDGVTIFRLTGDGKTVVYMTDCTLTDAFSGKRSSLLQIATCFCATDSTMRRSGHPAVISVTAPGLPLLGWLLPRRFGRRGSFIMIPSVPMRNWMLRPKICLLFIPDARLPAQERKSHYDK